MEAEKILVLEPDTNIMDLIALKLSGAGYEVTKTISGSEALQKAVEIQPDLFIISIDLPGQSGLDVCHELRQNENFSNTPIVLMGDRNFNKTQLKFARFEVDDILIKPVMIKNVVPTVNACISKYKILKQLNPQTLLPGRMHIQEMVNSLFEAKEFFDIVFCDLKGFGAYNKKYGYDRGDQVIRFAVDSITKIMTTVGLIGCKLYHLGGDDFVILSRDKISDEFCQSIINLFHEGIMAFYDADDVERGGLVFINRRGLMEQSPILTIDLAIVSNRTRSMSNWLEVEAIGKELIEYSKTIPGSQWVKDRRKS